MPRLLIVDDEEDVREFAAKFFRKRKIEVVTVASAEEALESIEKDKPDLVLLDIKMSGMDGIEALRRIREIEKELKVIMVTGRKPEDDDSFNKCSQLGALGYVHKPLELDELEKIVLTSLEK